MNRRQRRSHFVTWLVLAALLVAIFVAAMLARRDASNLALLPSETEQG